MSGVNGVQQDKSAKNGVVLPRQAVLDFTQETGITITFDGKPIEAKSKPIEPAAGVTAAQIKTVVDHLKIALKGTNSKYTLKDVVAKLQAKGIPLEKLMDKVKEILLDGMFSINNLSDDEVIKAALQAIGLPADEITALEIKTNETKPEDISALATEEEPAAKPETKPANKPIAPPITVAVSYAYPAWASADQKKIIDLLIKINPKLVSDPKLRPVLEEAVRNGKIDKTEAKALSLDGKGGDLFRAIDNNMRAGLSGGDGSLTLSEIEEAVKVMESFAGHAKISLADAANLYQSMYLVDLDFSGIDGKLGELTAAARSGLPSFDGAGNLSESVLGNKLSALKALMSSDLFSLLTAQIKGGKITSADAVGVFAFRSAMASMTGNYEVFQVKDLQGLVNKGTISPFKPKRAETSAADFAEWVKEGKVKAEDKETGGVGEKSDEQKDYKIGSQLEKAIDLDSLNKVVNENRKEIEGSAKLAQIAAEKYYPYGQYDKYVELMKLLPKEERDKSFANKVAVLASNERGAKLYDALQEAKGADIQRKGSEAINKLEKLLKAMGAESAGSYNNDLYAAKYLLAQTLVKKDMAKEALEIAGSIPADGQLAIPAENSETMNRTQSRTITVSGLEAKYRIAYAAGDAKAIAAPESAGAVDKALAKVYQAKLELQSALKELPPNYKTAEKALERYAEAVKTLSTSQKSVSEVRERLVDDVKALIKENVGAMTKLGTKLTKLLTTASKHKKEAPPAAAKEEKAGKDDKPAKQAKEAKPDKAEKPAGGKTELDSALKGKINSYLEGVIKGDDIKTDAGVTIAWSGGKLQITNDEDLHAKALAYAKSYLTKKYKNKYVISLDEGNDVIKQSKK